MCSTQQKMLNGMDDRYFWGTFVASENWLRSPKYDTNAATQRVEEKILCALRLGGGWGKRVGCSSQGMDRAVVSTMDFQAPK